MSATAAVSSRRAGAPTVGMPVAEDFRVESRTAARDPGRRAADRNRLLAIDPAIRGFLDDRPSYLPPVAIGEAVRGMTLGRVSARATRVFRRIDRALLAAWEEFSIATGQALGLEILEPDPACRSPRTWARWALRA
jgi:NADPH-dependent curcumin reductase CurA